MTRARLHALAIPAFLLLCLLAGGSRQGIWANAALQLIAVLLIAWAVLARREEPATAASRQLVALIVAALILVVLQLVPLPPGLWTSLPGREGVAAGFRLLGYELRWLPLSLAPFETLSAAYTVLPPLAIVAMAVAFGACRERWVALAVVAGALASLLLGAVQVGSGGTAGWAYLYDITNAGAVGAFANRNHMATLLLAAIPFAGALFVSGWAGGRGKALGLSAIGAGAGVLILAGLLLNDSLAALALAVPVVALTVLILPGGWRLRRLVLPLGAVALVIAVVLVGSSSVASEFAGEAGRGSSIARGAMWDGTVRLIGETFPFGTGLGTFPQVFAIAEDPAAVGRAYVNHAHSDYLEIVLETGLPGLLLLVLFLWWWGLQAVRIWRSPDSSRFAKAATIASGAILAHSVVDYPLRTAAIGTLFAACIGMMALPRTRRRSDAPKHVRIG